MVWQIPFWNVGTYVSQSVGYVVVDTQYSILGLPAIFRRTLFPLLYDVSTLFHALGKMIEDSEGINCTSWWTVAHNCVPFFLSPKSVSKPQYGPYFGCCIGAGIKTRVINIRSEVIQVMK